MSTWNWFSGYPIPCIRGCLEAQGLFSRAHLGKFLSPFRSDLLLRIDNPSETYILIYYAHWGYQPLRGSLITPKGWNAQILYLFVL